MKKGISLLLSLLMVLALAAATASAGEPLAARFIYHSLLEQMAKEDIDTNDNRLINFHKEQSGIDIVIEWPAGPDATEEAQKRAMILASGDVPDLMVFPSSPTNEFFQYAVDGVLLPLDDYLADMPNYLSLVPESTLDMCRVDGVLYAFPGSHEELMTWGGDGVLVRSDVYAGLGLDKAPQTADEYYEMWKAVKETTGMIPLVALNANTALNTAKAAFGVLSQTKEVDGQLVFTWASPEFKEYLAYMNKLYVEGLLDREYISTTTADMQEKFLNNAAFSTFTGWATPCVTINGTLDVIEGADFIYLPQMTKDAETPAELTKPFPSQRINAIPAMAKNPDTAAKWIEYMSTPDAKKAQNYGIEGIDYQVVDGNIQQTLDEQNNVGWKINYEYIPTEASFQVRLYAKGFDKYFNDLYASRDASNVIGVEEALIFLPPNEDFLNLQQQLALKQYSDEQANLFIMGERPMEDYDKYLAELEQRGLPRLVAALNEWADSAK